MHGSGESAVTDLRGALPAGAWSGFGHNACGTMLVWGSIDTVLLDMDGTLLDLNFDDYFWREHVPRRFAEKNGVPLDQARRRIFERYRALRGTLQWYCVDYWSRELGLDIAALKEEVEHLIVAHPHVPQFLARLRALGKTAILVTNAHGKSLALKMRRTRMAESLDGLVCAHDLGLPKQDPAFWEKLRALVPFDRERTLLVDDDLDVLASARSYGIRYLVSVVQPNSCRPPRAIEGFAAIRSFLEILP